MIKTLLFACLAFFMFSLGIAQNYIMQGKIGAQDATLAFIKKDSNIYDAKYYFNANKNLVVLEAEMIDSSEIRFTSMTANDEDTLAYFTLIFSEDGFHLNGLYVRNDKTSDDALFSWLNILTIPHLYEQNDMIQQLKEEVPLLYVYTADLTFDQNIKEVTQNGKKVRIVAHHATNTQSIRFINPTRAEKFIAEKVDSIALEQVIAALDCNPKYETAIDIKRNDDLIFSFVYRVDFDCDGRSGDYYEQGYTFDKNTGTQITLSQIFNLKNEKTTNDSLNGLAALKNDGFIKALLPDVFDNGNASICTQDQDYIFKDKNFYLIGLKIHLVPYYSKAQSECRNTLDTGIKLEKVKEEISLEMQGILGV